MKNLIFSIIIFFIIGIAGCSKKDEPQQKTETSPKTEDVKTVKPKDTVSTVPKLPAEFPDDFPMYKGAKIISSTKGGLGPIVSLQSNDKSSDVGNFYKTEMKKNGYKPSKDNDRMTNDEGGIQEFTKDGKQYTISYHYNTDHTSIVIQMQDVK